MALADNTEAESTRRRFLSSAAEQNDQLHLLMDIQPAG